LTYLAYILGFAFGGIVIAFLVDFAMRRDDDRRFAFAALNVMVWLWIIFDFLTPDSFKDFRG
jgi:hypothetical protein